MKDPNDMTLEELAEVGKTRLERQFRDHLKKKAWKSATQELIAHHEEEFLDLLTKWESDISK